MRYLSVLLLALFLSASALAETPAAPAAAPVVAPVVPVVAPVVPVVAPGATVMPPAPLAPAVSAAPAVVAPVAPAVEEPVAEGVKVPETDAEAGEMIGLLLDAAQNGHWTIFGGLMLLLIIWQFNRMGLAARIGRDYVPWATVVVGAAAGIGVGLATGSPVGEAFKLGVLEGGIAISLWELIFKRFTGLKTDGTVRKPVPAAPSKG